MVIHAFNFSTQEIGMQISWVLDQSTEKVPGKLSLGSEPNHWKQKAGEDVIEQVSHVPAAGHGNFSHVTLALYSRIEKTTRTIDAS